MSERIQTWATRSAFLFAAIGSAVGLGNLWRFPYVAYENGGGAFFIPYLIALITTGIPLLMLEFHIGKESGKAAPAGIAWLSSKFESVGWLAALVVTIIGFYYSAVLAWSIQFLLKSFSVGWAGGEQDFFFNNILQISSGPGEIGGIVWPLLLGVIVVWSIVYFSLFRGVSLLGKIVKWTVWVPITLLVILTIRGVTLDGAMDGLAFYLTPDWAVLTQAKVWLAAYSQIFFSLSIAFGIMIVYARHLPKDSDVVNSARIVGFANSGVSFLAGLAVFSTLGFLAAQSGQAVADVATSGPGLVFVTYPAALAQLPGAVFFSVIFFIALLTLGIDSLYSIVESLKGALIDKGMSEKGSTLLMCVMGFFGSLLFVTNSGLYWLDIVDHWIVNYGGAAVGLLECVLVGWFIDTNLFRENMNIHSEAKAGKLWEFFIKFLTPAILAITIGQSLINEFSAPYEGYPQWALNLGGWLLTGIIFALSILLMKNKIKWKILAWFAFLVVLALLSLNGFGALALGIFGGTVIYGGLWMALGKAKMV